MKIAVVTDSTADIPQDLVDEHQIEVMPNIIIIDGKSYMDNRDISRYEFYELLPGMKSFPTTATASSGSYQTLYEKLFRLGFEHILSIHASSRLSGIINAASTAAQAFENRVHIIDSGQVTLGLGFQVLMAAEDIARGLSLEAVITHVMEIGRRVRLMAMLDTLEYIHRSGRVGWAKARLGTLLHIKPFVELKDGLVQSLGEVRTRSKGIERLRKLLLGLGPLERLAILHTNSDEDAHQFLASVDTPLAYPPLVVNVTTIIGAHVGPHCLGFTVVTQA